MTPIPTTIITRPLPNGVTYDLSTPNQVTITLPRNSTWTSGLHWHETHTEYLCLLRGAIRVRLGDTTRIISVQHGEEPLEIEVGRGVWHEWGRASPDDDEEVVVVERTDPADGEKALFFWNLNGVILRAQGAVRPSWVPVWAFAVMVEGWVMLGLFVIFGQLDNFPVLLDVEGRLARLGVALDRDSTGISRGVVSRIEELWSHAVLRAAEGLGRLLGMKAVRPEFTPDEVYHRWASAKNDRKIA